MSDTKAILRTMQALAEDAATRFDEVTIGSANKIYPSADNFVEAEDGFHRIDFDDDVADAAYTVTYDASSRVLTLQNLTSGEFDSVDIGSTSIRQNHEQLVRFDGLRAEIALNSAFDKSVDINNTGSSYQSYSGDGAPGSTVKILNATDHGANRITSNTMLIEALTTNNATLNIAAYSASNIDLTTEGPKLSIFTDGTNAFTIEFEVQTPFSDGDRGSLDIDALGTLIFSHEILQSRFSYSIPLHAESVEANLNAQSSSANRLEPEDGIEAIEFATDIVRGVFLVSYDATSGLLKALNLSDKSSQSIDIGRDRPIAAGEIQSVEFASVGVTVHLNELFDKTADLPETGGLATFSGSGSILESSIEITDTVSDAGVTLTTTEILVDATDASSAILTIDGYTASKVNLSVPKVKGARFGNGHDSFEIKFEITSAFSDGDSGSIDLPQLGQLVFSDPQGQRTRAGGDDGERIIDRLQDDRIDGGGGDDVLFGEDGDDSLLGGAGNDFFVGVDGLDVYDGGAGGDTLVLSEHSQAFEVRLSAGTASTGDDQATLASIENVVGGDGADEIRGDAGVNLLDGGGGDDMLAGGNGDDGLAGGDGDDMIKGGAGDDLALGGDGDDIVYGGDGDDRVSGNLGADWLKGEDGDDELFGGSGDDRLFGDDGADLIDGGSGLNRLKGGAGADIFQIDDGATDRIYDFEDGVDRIDLGAFQGLASIDDLDIAAIRDGGSTKVSAAVSENADGFGEIILIGIEASAIGAADFQF